MPDLLLVTCGAWPDGEPNVGTLVTELTARGVTAALAAWDDPTVDWAGADLIAVRSTWDYVDRCAEFLAWAERVERSVPLLNGSATFRWNVDKAYLVALGDHVSVVPTLVADTVPEIEAARAAYGGSVVVKPATGVGGFGVLALGVDEGIEEVGEGPWIVQPLVESVRSVGETSVYVFDGQPASQVNKRPAPGEVRVHPHFGGSYEVRPLSAEAAELAGEAVAVVQSALGHRLDYARLDLLRLADGRLAVSEVEAVEPSLYLDVLPENAGPFADLVAARLKHTRDR